MTYTDTDQYKAGFDAVAKGKNVKDNPEQVGTLEHSYWDAGFEDGGLACKEKT